MTTSTSGTTGGPKWRNLKTGGLFFIGLVLVGSLALIISKNTGLGKPHRSARLFVLDTKGLTEGNPVSIAGKKVGTVSALEFSRLRDTTGVLVTLDIESQHFQMIPEDSRATIKGLGMLGDKFIDISLGKSSTKLADGGQIPASTEPGMEDLTSNAIATAASVNELLGVTLNISRKIDRGEGSFGRLLNSTELSDRLTGTVANLEALSGQLSSGDGIVSQLFTNRELAGQLTSTIASLHQVSQQLSQSMNNGTGTLGKLLTDDTMYNRMNDLVANTDSLLIGLRQKSAALDGFSPNSPLFAGSNRSIQSLDELLKDMKKRPDRYVHVSVFK
jgi:phospholipid/cholesterol/gamma-HCH transport system substrate-binding protein